MIGLKETILEAVAGRRTGKYKYLPIDQLSGHSTKEEILDALDRCPTKRCEDGISRNDLYNIARKTTKNAYTVWNRVGRISICDGSGNLLDIWFDKHTGIPNEIWKMKDDGSEFVLISKFLDSISTIDDGIEELKTMLRK